MSESTVPDAPSKSAIEQVVNLSWQNPTWNWLAHAFPSQQWLHVTSRVIQVLPWLPKQASWARLVAGLKAVMATRARPSILVSHGPIPATYGALIKRLLNPRVPHLIYAFNFTDLPKGLKARLMGRAFRYADRYTVFSTVEKDLYARYFQLPLDRFDMIHWAANPLPHDASEQPMASGDYVCAIGSQGRDYPTLLEAMARLPHIKLVLVAQPQNLVGCQIPANVVVHTNISLPQVANILTHCRFMVLPLRDAEVPCGHVTIVSAFHQGKAVLATDSKGVHDYITDLTTGRLAPPNNAEQLAQLIQTLWQDPEGTTALGQAGQRFAAQHCTEAAVVRYFEQFIKSISS